MSDIFISYAKEDRERVRVLAEALRGTGLSIFWDRTVPPGLTWRQFIGSELEDARCLVVAWSSAAVKSRWVLEEAEDAARRRILIPVRFETVEPPLGFRSLQAVSFSRWDGTAEAPEFGTLVRAIRRVIAAGSLHPSEAERSAEPRTEVSKREEQPALPHWHLVAVWRSAIGGLLGGLAAGSMIGWGYRSMSHADLGLVALIALYAAVTGFLMGAAAELTIAAVTRRATTGLRMRLLRNEVVAGAVGGVAAGLVVGAIGGLLFQTIGGVWADWTEELGLLSIVLAVFVWTFFAARPITAGDFGLLERSVAGIASLIASLTIGALAYVALTTAEHPIEDIMSGDFFGLGSRVPDDSISLGESPVVGAFFQSIIGLVVGSSFGFSKLIQRLLPAFGFFSPPREDL